MSKFTTTLTIGDWSHDGHNMCDDYVYHTNYSQEHIAVAYELAVKGGVPDITKQCEDYEHNALDYRFVKDWLEKSVTSHPQLKQLNDTIFDCCFLCDDKISSWAATEEDEEDDTERAKQLAEKYDLQIAVDERDKFVSGEQFALIYLFIAKTHLTDLEYTTANLQGSLKIGGYGLFNS